MRDWPVPGVLAVTLIVPIGCDAMRSERLLEALFASERFRSALIELAEQSCFAELDEGAVIVIVEQRDCGQAAAYVLQGRDERRSFLMDVTAPMESGAADSAWSHKGIALVDPQFAREVVEGCGERADLYYTLADVWVMAWEEMFASRQIRDSR